MKYMEFREVRDQGTFNFPIAYYHQTKDSSRYEMDYHWHRHYEIIHICSGSFNLTLDNDPGVYNAGDIIFISDGVLHGGIPQDCVYDCVVFDLEMLLMNNHACADTIRKIINREIKINTLISKDCPIVRDVAVELFAALASQKEGREFMIQGLLYQLIGLVIEHKLYERVVSDAQEAQRLRSIKKVLDYISLNYNETITLSTLARIAGMNAKYFCRYFKSMTEHTPIDYINYYRINCACEMLMQNSDIPIKELAAACGFSDNSYFIKTFSKYKGTTPKKFIKDSQL